MDSPWDDKPVVVNLCVRCPRTDATPCSVIEPGGTSARTAMLCPACWNEFITIAVQNVGRRTSSSEVAKPELPQVTS